jgi:hypothetical protein
MARKRYKPEEIVAKLRQVDVLVSQGQAMADAIRPLVTRACWLPLRLDASSTFRRVPSSSADGVFFQT